MTPKAAGTTLVSQPMVHGRVSIDGKAVCSPWVFVTRRLLPSHYPQIRASVGATCEQGGKTDHACVIARILGRPVIMVPGALQVLQDGEEITIDSRSGLIWRGLFHGGHDAFPSSSASPRRRNLRGSPSVCGA